MTGDRTASSTLASCLACRRRKIRCDRAQPNCAHCSSHNVACVYGSDRRKIVSASHVNALRDRITVLENVEEHGQVADLRQRNQTLLQRVLALERALNENGISVGDALSTPKITSPLELAAPPTSNSTRTKRPSSGEEREAEGIDPDEDDVDWGGQLPGRLQRDGEDGLIYFGSCGTLQHASTLARNLNSTTAFSIPTSSPARSDNPLHPRAPFDWARHLPANVISRETHDHLLDIFDSFFGPWCCVINMSRFRSNMRRCLTEDPTSGPSPDRAAHYSPMLHNALLALACTLWKGDRLASFPALYRGGPSGVEAASQASQAFYDHSRLFMESEVAKPVESTIRAMLLLASWNASRSTATLGYVYAGTAFRMCSVLGVNIDCSKYVDRGVISAEVQTTRAMLFNTCFIQERLWALGQGRFPMTLHANEHDIPLPAIDAAADSEPWKAPKTYTFAPGAREPPRDAPSWVSTCFHWTLRLAQVQDDIVKLCYGLTASRPELSQWSALSLRLEAWATDLPRVLSMDHFAVVSPPPHVITLQMTYQKAILLLHRPFFNRSAGVHLSSAERCEEAAHKLVKLFQLYDSVYGLPYAPLTSTHAGFMAGTVFLLSARNSVRKAAKRARSSLDGLSACLVALDRLGTTWSHSTRAILEALRDKWIPNGPLAVEDGSRALSSGAGENTSDFSLGLSPLGSAPHGLETGPGPSTSPQTEETWLTMFAGLAQVPGYQSTLAPPNGAMYNPSGIGTVADEQQGAQPISMANGLFGGDARGELPLSQFLLGLRPPSGTDGSTAQSNQMGINFDFSF